MTSEPTHTSSKERMAPELMFSSERTHQLSNTASKVQWPLCLAFSCAQPVTTLQMKSSRKSVSATIQSPRKYDDSRAPNYQLLPRKCSYVQPITQHYKRITVFKSSLKSIQSPQKIRTIPIYKRSPLQTYCRKAMYCATANRHLELSAKRNGTQRRTKVSL